SDGNGSHASTLKSPSYTKSVSWQHYPLLERIIATPATRSDFLKADIIFLYIKISKKEND
ncbi:hypothetical protein, partial [Escherichia coli]|uniref:hypothetical protein n=1 Tax=Escherichia coli TaxID=562 RepID=UPI001A8F2AB7